MTMLDDRKPTTVQTMAESTWPGAGRHVHGRGEGASSVLSCGVSARRSPPARERLDRGAVPVNGSAWLFLPGTPWSMRLACGSGVRPALEVYAAGSLLDVVVASSRSGRLLRGACAVVIAGQARTIA